MALLVIVGVAAFAAWQALRSPDVPPRAVPVLEPAWRGGFETGDLSQYVDAPWNFEGNGPPQLVGDPVLAGDHAARFELEGGDRRQEIVAGRGPEEAIEFEEGDDYYFRFATYFDERWPVTDSWQVFTQWKDDGSGSPPIAMLAGSWGKDRIHLAASGWPGGGSDEVHDLGPLLRGKWISWVVRIKFSTDPEDAAVQVWRDGRRIVSVSDWRPSFDGEEAGSEGATLRSGRETHLKMGIYRDPEIDQPARLWMDGWVIGEPA